MEWLGDPMKLGKLKMNLEDMSQNMVVNEASNVLRHFIGEKGQYGVGKCFFWDHKVPKECLRISGKKLNLKNDKVSLSDIILWKNFNIRSFGRKPKAEFFTMKIGWRMFCIALIEIGYATLGLNPDNHVVGINAVNAPINISHDSSYDFEESDNNSIPKETSSENMITAIFEHIKDYSEIDDQSIL